MNIKDTLKQIATLREIKGKEKETYELIEQTKIEAKTQKDWGSLAQLFWEESLVAQHEAMNEFSKEEKEQDKENTQKFIRHMEESAVKASEIIEENDLEKKYQQQRI